MPTNVLTETTGAGRFAQLQAMARIEYELRDIFCELSYRRSAPEPVPGSDAHKAENIRRGQTVWPQGWIWGMDLARARSHPRGRELLLRAAEVIRQSVDVWFPPAVVSPAETVPALSFPARLRAAPMVEHEVIYRARALRFAPRR